MLEIDKIKTQLVKNGFSEHSNYQIPTSLLWQPDLVLAKNDYTYLILIKSNNTIPPSFLNRISRIPKGSVIPLIIFTKKVNIHTSKEILSLGISIAYFARGKIFNLQIKKKRSSTEVKKELKKKLKAIDIFISSKQEIQEREFINERIQILRDTYHYPFFTHLIEYDKFDINKLYLHIKHEIKNCEWIIIILEDSFSKVVRYEIKNALKIIEHKNIFVFVKSSLNCQKSWKSDLSKIKNLEDKTVKYLPYTDFKNLEITLNRTVIKRMNEICKKEKVDLYL